MSTSAPHDLVKHNVSNKNGLIATINLRYTIRDTRCYFNVQSKADMSQLNLLHGTNNKEVEKQKN